MRVLLFVALATACGAQAERGSTSLAQTCGTITISGKGYLVEVVLPPLHDPVPSWHVDVGVPDAAHPTHARVGRALHVRRRVHEHRLARLTS